ncbi:hypothetical protein [Paenibacillus donghaensis]|uniref:hypothetical protein n=1 Tax=Paenibacillus donghaensis TaxID=414771 RepID=UPI0012FDB83E|nr:hypothetical protein [Paenibacillus donghaensis]
MDKAKYVVTEHKGHWVTNDAYSMKDVQAIVSGLIREAKEEGRKTLSLMIEIK